MQLRSSDANGGIDTNYGVLKQPAVECLRAVSHRAKPSSKSVPTDRSFTSFFR
jgi:hypothetical protein